MLLLALVSCCYCISTGIELPPIRSNLFPSKLVFVERLPQRDWQSHVADVLLISPRDLQAGAFEPERFVQHGDVLSRWCFLESRWCLLERQTSMSATSLNLSAVWLLCVVLLFVKASAISRSSSTFRRCHHAVETEQAHLHNHCSNSHCPIPLQ